MFKFSKKNTPHHQSLFKPILVHSPCGFVFFYSIRDIIDKICNTNEIQLGSLLRSNKTLDRFSKNGFPSKPINDRSWKFFWNLKRIESHSLCPVSIWKNVNITLRLHRISCFFYRNHLTNRFWVFKLSKKICFCSKQDQFLPRKTARPSKFFCTRLTSATWCFRFLF